MKTIPYQQIASVAVLALISVLTVACQSGDKSPKDKPAPEVGVMTIKLQSQPLETELPGRTAAHMVAEIRPQVGGIILKRAFTEGANVKAGELLYQIDPAPYQAAYASAQAALQKTEASLVSTRLKAERYAQLVKINAVSSQDNDDIQATLRQGEADLASAKAALETARINLAYTRIVSPIAGRVETSTVTPGALVTANQTTALTTVQQLDPIYVDITQPSSALLQLKRQLASGALKKSGENATRMQVVLEDGSRYAHDGVLSVTGVTVNQSSGAVTLRAVVPNPEGLLLPGMYVRGILQEAVNTNAILIPQLAMSRNNRGEGTALVVDAENKAELRTLSVERAIGNQWLISKGLSAGEKLIVEGLQKVKVGDTVKSVEVAAPGVANTTPSPAGAAAPAAGK